MTRGDPLGDPPEEDPDPNEYSFIRREHDASDDNGSAGLLERLPALFGFGDDES